MFSVEFLSDFLDLSMHKILTSAASIYTVLFKTIVAFLFLQSGRMKTHPKKKKVKNQQPIKCYWEINCSISNNTRVALHHLTEAFFFNLYRLWAIWKYSNSCSRNDAEAAGERMSAFDLCQKAPCCPFCQLPKLRRLSEWSQPPFPVVLMLFQHTASILSTCFMVCPVSTFTCCDTALAWHC